MNRMRLFCSAVLSAAALAAPAMAQGRQRVRTVETICNDGTVLTNVNRNACRRHSGVRSVTTMNTRSNNRMENGKMLPGTIQGTMQGNMEGQRGVYAGRGNRGMTTAEQMQMLHIDHTRNNATAKCQDGFYYHGNHDRSACARDGGVSAWYK
jgi:uncharacterized protein DUF3761